MEPIYESWAINRIVYSIVAATGFKQPEGKTRRRTRLPLQAGAAVNTHRQNTRCGCPRKKILSQNMLQLVITALSNLLATVKLNN